MKEKLEIETNVTEVYGFFDEMLEIKTDTGNAFKFFPSDYAYFPQEGIYEGEQIKLFYYINQAIYAKTDPTYLLRYFVFKGLAFNLDIDTGNYGFHQKRFEDLPDYKKEIYKEVELFNGYLKFKN